MFPAQLSDGRTQLLPIVGTGGAIIAHGTWMEVSTAADRTSSRAARSVDFSTDDVIAPSPCEYFQRNGNTLLQ